MDPSDFHTTQTGDHWREHAIGTLWKKYERKSPYPEDLYIQRKVDMFSARSRCGFVNELSEVRLEAYTPAETFYVFDKCEAITEEEYFKVRDMLFTRERYLGFCLSQLSNRVGKDKICFAIRFVVQLNAPLRIRIFMFYQTRKNLESLYN